MKLYYQLDQILKEQKEPDFQLQALPYAFDYLEPAINQDLLKIHYENHHSSYVNGLNQLMRQNVRDRGWYQQLSFNWSGDKLHQLYWNCMSKENIKIPSKMLSLIEKNFGNESQFKKSFIEASTSVEGNGWGALYHSDGKLFIGQIENHQNSIMVGLTPVLICDVWEHAYYLQYESDRKKYVESFYDIINWEFVANNID